MEKFLPTTAAWCLGDINRKHSITSDHTYFLREVFLFSPNTKGALLMSLATASYIISDVFMKYLSKEVDMFVITFLRGLGVTFILLLFCFYLKVSLNILERKDKVIVFVRSLFEVLMTYSFLIALFNMNIANANAILQLIPLVVLIGAFFFLKKPLKNKEVLAVCIGLIGALIVIKPGASDFNFYTIFALIAVMLLSGRDLVTVNINKSISSVVIAFYSSVLLTLVSFIFSFKGLSDLQLSNPLYILLTAFFVSIGYIASVSAMRVGNVTFVSPFRYTALLWAIIMGYMFFNEIPQPSTIMGGIVIILAGIYIFYNKKSSKV